MNNKYSKFSLSLLGTSLILAVIILFNVTPYIRGGFGWRWPFATVDFGSALVFMSVSLVYFVGAYLLVYRVQRKALIVLWAFVGAVIMPYLALSLRYDDIVYEMLVRTLSGVTTGPHLAASGIEWNPDTLANWPAHMADFVGRNVHMSVSPPGFPVFYAFLNRLFQLTAGFPTQVQQALLPYQCDNFNVLFYDPAAWASALLGMLTPVWAALSIFPLYISTKRLLSDHQAYWAIIWWPLVPSISMFVSSPNTLYPLFSITAFAFAVVWWQSESRYRFLWIVAAGLTMGLATFAYFAFVPLLGLFTLYFLGILVRRHRFRISLILREGVVLAGWFCLGICLPWVVFWFASKLTPVDILSAAFANHLVLDRPYLPWLWLHLQDWVLFTGFPLAVLWLVGLFKLTQKSRQDALYSTGFILLVTMVILDLSGTSRAETGRVWSLYSPFVLIAAADGLYHTVGPKFRKTTWVLATLSQVMLFAALVTTWDVLHSDLKPPPSPPGGLMTTHPINASFDSHFSLVSWDATVENNAVTLKLDWQSTQQVTTPYWFSALLVGPDGVSASEAVVWQPLDTVYPTTCWSPGEWVGDTIALPLPENPAAGDWWVSLSAFGDVETPEVRVPVTNHDGSQDMQVGIGPIPVQ